jgi:hypothetical protein
LVVIQLSTVMPLPACKPGSHLAGIEDVGHRDVDVRHAARQVEQRLRQLHRREYPAPVQVLVADVEQAGHLQQFVASAGGAQEHLVAHGHAEILRQFDADDGVGALDLELAARHVGVHLDDAAVAVGIDADQCDRLARTAAQCERRAADHRRHRHHARLRLGQFHDGFPLVDRTQALRARLDDGGTRHVGPGAQIHLFQRPHDDMRLTAQHAVDDGGLQLCDELRQEHDDRHPARHAEQDERRLHAPLAQEAQRDQKFEGQPGSGHGQMQDSRLKMQAKTSPVLLASFILKLSSASPGRRRRRARRRRAGWRPRPPPAPR